VVPALPDGVSTWRIEATTLSGSGSSLNRGAGESPGVAGSVSRMRSRPKRKGKAYCFPIFFNAKTILEKSRNCIKGKKNTQKLPKISGKFAEID
jgi:hypothetical protein